MPSEISHMVVLPMTHLRPLLGWTSMRRCMVLPGSGPWTWLALADSCWPCICASAPWCQAGNFVWTRSLLTISLTHLSAFSACCYSLGGTLFLGLVCAVLGVTMVAGCLHSCSNYGNAVMFLACLIVFCGCSVRPVMFSSLKAPALCG